MQRTPLRNGPGWYRRPEVATPLAAGRSEREGNMVDVAKLARSLEIAQRKRRLVKHSRPWQPVFTPATSLG